MYISYLQKSPYIFLKKEEDDKKKEDQYMTFLSRLYNFYLHGMHTYRQALRKSHRLKLSVKKYFGS